MNSYQKSSRLETLTNQIGEKAKRVLEDGNSELMLSSLSLVEIAIKVRNNKLAFQQAAVDSLIERLGIQILDFTRAAANVFDRMLISSALAAGTPFVCADAEFTKYTGLKVIWQ